LSTPHRTTIPLPDAPMLHLASPWRFSAASLRGVHARVNQDSYACRSPDFFMVADGVGGGALGEVASAMLVNQLGQLEAPDAGRVQQALTEADQAIAQRLQQEGQGPGAAVCAAVWLIDAQTSNWLAMTVGDCKIMLAARVGDAWQLRWSSPNQSYAQCGLPPPEGIDPASPANMVGCGMAFPALIEPITLLPGERLLLCSDGFYNAFSDAALCALVGQSTGPLAPQTAQHWAEQAQQQGANDDVTVLVVERALNDTDTPPVDSLWARRSNRVGVFAIGLLAVGALAGVLAAALALWTAR
jgi:PPM family protein phosphatase